MKAWFMAFLCSVVPQIVGAASPQEEIERKVPAALAILDGWQAEDPESAERMLHIVYWSPSDREPQPEARERLSAILEDIRDFYAGEMKRLGFGPRSIKLDHEADGQLKLHQVKGRKPYREYQVNSGSEIRNECLETLREAGLDPERETLVIFCNMANWNAETSVISQNSPYYAGGTHASGTAWQVDSPILNLESLAKKEPRVRDGQYGDISIGRYNSIFIGGVCHELGHALGLPHNCQRKDEQEAFGTALMGSGNRSYGEDRRGEGKGSFLTLAHGLKLASHPMFSGSVKQMDRRANARIEGLEVEPAGSTFTVRGRVRADPPAYALIGYMDPEGGGDYDATSCTAVPDAEGYFSLEAGGLVPGANQKFRIVVCQANGACTSYAGSNSPWTIPYEVDDGGMVNLSAWQAVELMKDYLGKVNAGDLEGASRELQVLIGRTDSAEIIGVAEALMDTLRPGPTRSPAEMDGSEIPLSRTKPAEARVGWGRPVMDRLPTPDVLITSGGRLVARGIYAHAPAVHCWQLGGKWRKLSGSVGLPESNTGGSCVFVISGDGREIWRSSRVTGSKAVDFEVELAGVKDLRLEVEDAGDGNGGDWGMWFSPMLSR